MKVKNNYPQYMRSIPLLFLLTLSVLILSCSEISYYSSEQIEIISIDKNEKSTLIEFIVPPETAYYPSVCDYTINEDSTIVSLRFIRQPINTKFSGHVSSTVLRRDNKISYSLSLPKEIITMKIENPERVIILTK